MRTRELIMGNEEPGSPRTRDGGIGNENMKAVTSPHSFSISGAGGGAAADGEMHD